MCDVKCVQNGKALYQLATYRPCLYLRHRAGEFRNVPVRTIFQYEVYVISRQEPTNEFDKEVLLVWPAIMLLSCSSKIAGGHT